MRLLRGWDGFTFESLENCFLRRRGAALGCLGPDVSSVLSVSLTLYLCGESQDAGGKPCNADNRYMHSWECTLVTQCFLSYSGPTLTDENGSLTNSGTSQLCSQLPWMAASCTSYRMCTSKSVFSKKCWRPEHLNEFCWWWYIGLLWSS